MNEIKSDSTRVMRIAAWMWLIYLLVMFAVDWVIYRNIHLPQISVKHLMNLIPALGFLILAYIPWRRRRWITVAMISLISISPILVNSLGFLRFPPGPMTNVEGMVLRQFPVLFIALVLVAWHSRLIVMLLYSLGINLLDVLFVMGFDFYRGEQLQVFFIVTLVRTLSFILVGFFINNLITRLREQQDDLLQANLQLKHYNTTLENLTISRERNRMSRELHDTVVHTLSGLSVQLETARAYQSVDQDAAAEIVDQALSAARSGLQETRRAIKTLRASPLDDLGLLLALETSAKKAAERADLELVCRLPQQLETLAPDVEQTVYRVAQEAIENVVQHANASQLTVKLDMQEIDNKLHLSLTISDDGIGVNKNNRSLPGHFGIAGMQERAQLAGGTLTIDSQPERGTSVRLTIEG